MKKLNIIAGPCSAETEEQVFETAKQLSSIGIKTLRAGIWKPRSRANMFEGVGAEAIPWLNRVQQELNMKVAVEVALPRHVEEVLKGGIDILWIGARTTVNPFMIQELAESLRGTSVPVFIKNPVCPDLELWTGAVERFRNQQIDHLSIIHRGFFTYIKDKYRNSPCWSIVEEFRLRFPELPFYCDPSHICGKREYIPELITSALEQNPSCDGLFIESHCCPDTALSDAAQQLTPKALKQLLNDQNILINE